MAGVAAVVGIGAATGSAINNIVGGSGAASQAANNIAGAGNVGEGYLFGEMCIRDRYRTDRK